MSWAIFLANWIWAIASLIFAAAAAVAGLALWATIIYGVGRLFKDWRLYSPHPLAKLIRRHLRRRRDAARARGRV